MKKIITILAAIMLTASSFAQDYKEVYRRAINTTCHLDSLICEGIVSAHQMPSQQECLQELAKLYSKAAIMVDIAKECDKAALQSYIATRDNATESIDLIIYSRQLINRIAGRIEKLESIIQVNQYNKARWSVELRYRNDYIDEFSKEAKRSGALKK